MTPARRTPTPRQWRNGAVAGLAVLAILSSTTNRGVVAAAASESQTRTVRDGVYTTAQAARGKAVYVAQCEVCHKQNLLGEQMTPSLVGVSFAFRWNGRNLLDYFTGLRSTMPQSAPGGLSETTYADLVAYILAENEYPAGDTELLADAGALSRIVIEADF